MKSWTDGIDPRTIPDEVITAEAKRRTKLRRVLMSQTMSRWSKSRTEEQRKGGRPRKNVKRCPCGEMTLKRAEARAHKCEAPAQG